MSKISVFTYILIFFLLVTLLQSSYIIFSHPDNRLPFDKYLPNLDKPSRIIEIGEAFYAIRYHKAMGIYYVYRNGDLLIGYIDPYEKNINSIDSLTLFSNIDKIRFQSIN